MELLAKSEPQVSLQEHIDDCLAVLHAITECFPSARCIYQSQEQDFWDTVRLSIILHDLGKAHPEFQKVLLRLPNEWHGQRHELFSLPFVSALEIEASTKRFIELVVAGHHKSYEKLLTCASCYEPIRGTGSLEAEEFFDFDGEFRKIDEPCMREFLLRVYGIPTQDLTPTNPNDVIRGYLREIRFSGNVASKEGYIKLLLLFGALKYCDHLGSAKLTAIERLEQKDFEFLARKRDELISLGSDFYLHQQQCGNARGNVILSAPTGSGKTESAMLWLGNQLKHFGQGRAFYILPFTASINAMYERLSHETEGFGAEKVGMLHGKLNDYLYDYFEDYQYDLKSRKERITALRQKFRTICMPLKVVTPFQLLKHLFGLKGFEQGLFECAGSFLIFDEIHAYSPRVFAQIKVLLEVLTKYFHAKVIIMTATLPTYLKTELCGITKPSVIEADTDLYRQFYRHSVSLEDGLLIDGLEQIRAMLGKGNRVLVVCNTVKQAQEVYQRLRNDADGALLLHGAFTGEDRSKYERDLRDGEKGKKKAVQLLVGTQAIEVSLDIDYDVIYTEPAPLDALIQRFGRVNRNRKKGIAPVVVFQENDPNDRFIYDPDIVAKTLHVIGEIILRDDGIIKEDKLQHYIDEVYNAWDKHDYSEFKDTYDLLSASLNYLFPMIHSRTNEEDFYKQFEGVKVLPVSLRDRYIDYLRSHDFIGAERLKVQIRRHKFVQLLREDGVTLFRDEFVYEGNHGLIHHRFWSLRKKYDPELGLRYDEQEAWNAESQVD